MRHKLPLTESDTGPRPASRAVSTATETLRSTVRFELGQINADFLKRLPPQMLSGKAASWSEAFLQRVDQHLLQGLDDDDGSDKQLVSSEEAIAIANVELRAESAHRRAVGVFEARLTQLRAVVPVLVYSEALTPTGLFRALDQTGEAMGWPRAQRRTLFLKFEEVVIAALPSLYRALMETMTLLAEGTAPAVKKPESAPAPSAPVDETPTPPPNTPPEVDPKTLSMLTQQAVKAPVGTDYNDGSLAADLLTLAGEQSLPDMPEDKGWVPLQRMELAGNFLNDSISDPLVPEHLRAQHEAVRFPLVKSALTDSTLFTAVTHPLRSLVNELLLKAATSHVTGSSEAKRMADLLQQVLVQFDLAPDFVRAAMLNAKPIAEDEIEKFQRMQHEQSVQRRDTVVKEAKRMVIREMELSTFGRGIPPPALKFLNGFLGPLMAKRLLRHGAAHPSWKASIALMDQILDQLDAREKDQAPLPEWLALMQTLAKELAAEGVNVETIKSALPLLESARQAPKTSL